MEVGYMMDIKIFICELSSYCKVSLYLSFAVALFFLRIIYYISICLKTLGWARVKHHCLCIYSNRLSHCLFVCMLCHMTVFTLNVIKFMLLFLFKLLRILNFFSGEACEEPSED